MTFADTKTIPNRSVVFFPACLGGSLDNALKQEGITDWQILTPEQAVREFNIDGRQIPPVKLYEDMTMTTNSIRVLISNFKPDEILHKIYMLHEDPAACEYRAAQESLLSRTLKEDGLL